MTLNDPLFMQNLTYTASEDRGIVEVLAGVGVLADGDLKVSQRAAGVNMSVDVAAGTVVIENAVASRGRYLCKSTAVTNLAIAASPGVGASRIDIVVATVTDTEYGDPSDAWVLQVITGTAGPSPTAPATPAGSLLLANIAVGTSVSSISNANITDVRPYARGLTYTNRLPTVAVDGQHFDLLVQHHDRRVRELLVPLDDCAGLVSVKPRHQDVTENQRRLVVVDLGQRVKTVFGKKHVVAALLEEYLGTPADGVAVVNHQDLET